MFDFSYYLLLLVYLFQLGLLLINIILSLIISISSI